VPKKKKKPKKTKTYVGEKITSLTNGTGRTGYLYIED
jgi:hypothetical protein